MKKFVIAFFLCLLAFSLGAAAAIQIIDLTYSLPDIPEQDSDIISQDPNFKKINDGKMLTGGDTALFGGWDSSKAIIIDVDLQRPVEIAKIQIWTSESETYHHMKSYKVYTSADQVSYSLVREVINPEPKLTEKPATTKCYPSSAENLGVRSRYLRIEAYGDPTGYQQIIQELEVFGRELPYLSAAAQVALPRAGQELAITAKAMPGAALSLAIVNSASEVVKNLGASSLETVSVSWNGKDEEGNYVPSGMYYARGTFSQGSDVTEKKLPLFIDLTGPRDSAITNVGYVYPEDPQQDSEVFSSDPQCNQLTDGGIGWGGNTSINSSWNAKDKRIIIVFDLQQLRELHEVKLWTDEFNAGTRIGGYELLVSDDGTDFAPVTTVYNHVPYRLVTPVNTEIFSLDAKLSVRARYVKIVAFPSGRIGNFFIDEVQFWGEALPQLELLPDAISPALGQKVAIAYEAAGAAQIEILNAQGEMVRSFSPAAAGGLINWDGKTEEGTILADGAYTVRLESCERTVTLKSQGPAAPNISSPALPLEGILEHNQDLLLLTGKAEEAATIKVFSGAEQSEIAQGPCQLSGAFSVNVPLTEGDNELEVWAFDEFGNPSAAGLSFIVNYDPRRPFGIPTIVNGDLLSPANADGYLDQLAVSFYLRPAGTAYLKVRDHAGSEVALKEKETAGEEEIALLWDGRQTEFVADGIYTVEVGARVGGEEIRFFTRTVRVDNEPPQDPILLYPAANAALTKQGLKFSWEKVADAAYYLFYLGTEEDLRPQTPMESKAAELAVNLEAKGTYYWQVKAVDEAGNISAGSDASFVVTDLDTSAFNLSNFAMTPNPFTPGTGRREKLAISFSLQQEGEVTVTIYNLAGKLVKKLPAGWLQAGDYLFTWDGADERGKAAQKGPYLVRVTAANPLSGPVAAITRPVLLLK